MKDWSKKRNDQIFALSACVDVVVVGKNGKDQRENCGTERLRSRVNRNKNRHAIVPFPCEQSLFAFQKLERRWNGTIAFPCEQDLKQHLIFVFTRIFPVSVNFVYLRKIAYRTLLVHFYLVLLVMEANLIQIFICTFMSSKQCCYFRWCRPFMENS